MRRVLARCVLLEIALRVALEHELRLQWVCDETLHQARELRREIRATA